MIVKYFGDGECCGCCLLFVVVYRTSHLGNVEKNAHKVQFPASDHPPRDGDGNIQSRLLA